MNYYSEFLQKAVDEVRTYAASTRGKKWSASWFKEIQRLLVAAAAEDENKKAEQYLDTVVHRIADSGPLDDRFAPSLDAARLAMQSRKKKPPRDVALS